MGWWSQDGWNTGVGGGSMEMQCSWWWWRRCYKVVVPFSVGMGWWSCGWMDE